MDKTKISTGDVIQVNPKFPHYGGCFGRVIWVKGEPVPAEMKRWHLNDVEILVEFTFAYGDRSEKSFKFADLGHSIEFIGLSVWGR